MVFSIINPIGTPVVFPSNIPERKRTSSGSLRWVTIADCPGFRDPFQTESAFKSIEIPAGHPSITPPSASPWDSPKVLNLNRVPKEFPAIHSGY